MRCRKGKGTSEVHMWHADASRISQERDSPAKQDQRWCGEQERVKAAWIMQGPRKSEAKLERIAGCQGSRQRTLTSRESDSISFQDPRNLHEDAVHATLCPRSLNNLVQVLSPISGPSSLACTTCGEFPMKHFQSYFFLPRFY